jgi:hypothetical protein
VLDHRGSEVDADDLGLRKAASDDSRRLPRPGAEIENAPRGSGQPVESGAERNERLGSDAGLPARRQEVELRPQRTAEQSPQPRARDDGARGDAGEAAAGTLERVA